MAALSATFSSSCHDPTGRFREAGLNRSPLSLPQNETYFRPFSDDLRPLETLTYVVSNFLALGAQCLSQQHGRLILNMVRRSFRRPSLCVFSLSAVAAHWPGAITAEIAAADDDACFCNCFFAWRAGRLVQTAERQSGKEVRHKRDEKTTCPFLIVLTIILNASPLPLFHTRNGAYQCKIFRE